MRILILLIALLVPVSGWAATYYMRADGTAANKGAATGCGSASTAMSVATHNAQTFSAGDVIYLCSDGGSYSASVSVPSSGSSGNPITYRNVVGQTPVIDVGVSSARAFYVGAKHYITVKGLDIRGGTAQAFYSLSSTATIVEDCTFYSTSYGLQFNSVTNGKWTNVTASLATGTGGYAIGTGAACANLVINNATVTSSSGYGVSINGGTTALVGASISNTNNSGLRFIGAASASISADSLTINRPALSAITTSGGIYIDATSASGNVISITNSTITNSGYYGILARHATTNTTLGAGSILRNINITGSYANGLHLDRILGMDITDVVSSGSISGSGIYLTNNSNTNISLSTVTLNASDGIDYVAGATGTVTQSNISYNGQVDSVANGDGISAHDNCFNISLFNNKIIGNRNSGFAHVNNSTGVAYNNVVVFNGDKTSTNMGVRGGWYTAGTTNWTQKNNIYVGNYPLEVNVGLTDTLVADYNIYYHLGNGITDENSAFSLGSGNVSWSTYHATNESNSKYGDPRLTSDYRLRPGSPCIKAGTPISGLTTDFAGKNWKNPPSIGAYEYYRKGGSGWGQYNFGFGW